MNVSVDVRVCRYNKKTLTRLIYMLMVISRSALFKITVLRMYTEDLFKVSHLKYQILC